MPVKDKSEIKMKIRMACEWNNLGEFYVDHFAISDGWADDGSALNPDERVEPVHRHNLTCFFKASTYATDFSDDGFRHNLNHSGHVFPFAEISEIMKVVLKGWDEKLILPYSDKLTLERNSKEFVGDRVAWQGFWKTDSAQRWCYRDWKQEQGIAYYDFLAERSANSGGVFHKTDYNPFRVVKQLSIASKRGTTEEITRELMMDFLFLLIVSIMNDDDLDRIYKMTFRLDEEVGKESDFGVEMTIKGLVAEIVNSWEEQLVLRYAEKMGFEETEKVLGKFEVAYSSDVGLKSMLRSLLKSEFFAYDPKESKGIIKDICDRYRRRIKRTVFLRALRQAFVDKDDELRRNVLGTQSKVEAQETERLRTLLASFSIGVLQTETK